MKQTAKEAFQMMRDDIRIILITFLLNLCIKLAPNNADGLVVLKGVLRISTLLAMGTVERDKHHV